MVKAVIVVMVAVVVVVEADWKIRALTEAGERRTLKKRIDLSSSK